MALIINGEEIDDEVIESEFRNVKGHYERQLQVACCERDPEFRGYAKDNILSRVLLNQEAKRRVPQVDEEAITARLARLIDEAGGETEFYMRIGMPYKDEAVVRENVANGVRLDQMLSEIYGPDPDPSEDEMRAFYVNHLRDYMSEETIHAAHITKSLQGATSRKDVFETMRGIRQELLAGEDFMKLAEQHRLDQQQMIDLGWFKRGEFMEEFETIAFSMREGEISPVFTTQLGFHVCTLLGRRPPEPIAFEQVKNAVRQRMIEEAKDIQFTAFIEQLKATADIQDTDPPEENGSCGH